MAKFDEDGLGPKPPYWFMGGDFSIGVPNGTGCSNLGRFDGAPLSRVRKGVVGSSNPVNGPVYSMLVFDADGAGPDREALYICGAFSHSENEAAYGLARWNGNGWKGLGTPELAQINPRAMIAFDDDESDTRPPALYMAGDKMLVRWDESGLSFVNEAAPLNGKIISLVVYDDDGIGPGAPALFAGGHFNDPSAKNRNNIAKWDGSQWVNLNAGLPDDVNCLAVYDEDGSGPNGPCLFAGQDVCASNSSVARWNGTAWSSVGTICYDGVGSIRTLLVFDEDADGPIRQCLLMSGDFPSVAKWDGNSWTYIPQDIFSYWWNALTTHVLATAESACVPGKMELLAGGNRFDLSASGMDRLLAKWDGAWSFPYNGIGGGGSAPGAIGWVQTKKAGCCPVVPFGSRFMRWEGRRWESIGTQNGIIRDMLTIPVEPDGTRASKLIVAGDSSGIDGGLISWSEGAGWQSIEPPLESGVVRAIQWSNNYHDQLPAGLYAVGSNMGFGNNPASMAMRLENGGWYDIMPPNSSTSTANACAIVDDDGDGPAPADFVVGGTFSFPGSGDQIVNVGRWDGRNWHSMPGLVGTVRQLTVVDLDGEGPGPASLYAIGNIGLPGQPTRKTALHWDGHQWYQMEGFLQIAYVFGYDTDGDGPAGAKLHVIGKRILDANINNYLYVWTGQDWQLTPGQFRPDALNNPTRSLTVDDDNDPQTPAALYITTPEFRYGQLRSHGLARFGPPLRVGLIPPIP